MDRQDSLYNFDPICFVLFLSAYPFHYASGAKIQGCDFTEYWIVERCKICVVNRGPGKGDLHRLSLALGAGGNDLVSTGQRAEWVGCQNVIISCTFRFYSARGARDGRRTSLILPPGLLLSMLDPQFISFVPSSWMCRFHVVTLDVHSERLRRLDIRPSATAVDQLHVLGLLGPS